MDDSFEGLIGLVLYGLFMLARWWLRGRQAQPAPSKRASPTPAWRAPIARVPPAPAPAAPAVPGVAVTRPWRDLDARAADLAALPASSGIAQAFSQTGRMVFRTTTGLEPELRARMGLPRVAPLLTSPDMLVARDLALPMGPWLETLFADAWATLALGPAYAADLRRTLAPSDGDQAVTVGLGPDGGYAAVPPAHLRVLLCCDLLGAVGHRAEASRQLSLWNDRLGEVDVFFLPTRSGWAQVPVDLLRAFGARVQEVITSEPLASLGGASLAALDGLRLMPSDQAACEQAAAALASGRTVRASPRVLLAAALLATADTDGATGVMAALRRSLAPAREAARAPRPAARRPAPTARASGFLDLSPAGLREAMIARAILWR